MFELRISSHTNASLHRRRHHTSERQLFLSSNGIYTGRIPQKALQISTRLLCRDNIWAILIMLQSATSEVLSALFDVFDHISINSEEFPTQSAEEKKREMMSVSTHNDVYWTWAIGDENRVRTGNNREQDWAGFSCSDFRRKHADLNMYQINLSLRHYYWWPKANKHFFKNTLSL